MSANTKIEWADHTFNPWIGCTKVGPGCDHCYAKADFDDRKHRVTWGAGQARSRTKTWGDPVRWNKQHLSFGIKHGRKQRVFCASLADVFDNEVDPQWRNDLFDLIRETPHLHWLLLTKRIGNVLKMLPSNTSNGPTEMFAEHYPNVWIGATICNQEEADRDIPKLLAIPAVQRFVSMEPLLGPIDLGLCDCDMGSRPGPNGVGGVTCARCNGGGGRMLDWVIVGGESGPNARPMHPDWARSLRDQCQVAGVPFLFKQWGEWKPISQMGESEYGRLYKSRVTAKPHEDQNNLDDIYGKTCTAPYGVVHLDGSLHHITDPNAFIVGAMQTFKVGKNSAGRLLDGREWSGFPV